MEYWNDSGEKRTCDLCGAQRQGSFLLAEKHDILGPFRDRVAPGRVRLVHYCPNCGMEILLDRFKKYQELLNAAPQEHFVKGKGFTR